MTDARERANLALMMVCLVFGGGARAGAADAPRTGDFTLAFTENGPLSAWREASARFFLESGAQAKEPGGARSYAIADEPFAMHVPKDYDGSRPYGLVVFAAPVPGGAPSADFAAVCDRHHLIWMGATRFSDQRAVMERARILVDGVHGLVQRYRIDPERLYLADQRGRSYASSGVGSMIIMGYPEVFTGGAMYLHGVMIDRAMLRDRAMTDRLLEQARKLRYAFVGDPDQPHTNYAKHVADQYQIYRNSGYAVTKFIPQPGLWQSNTPSKESFEAAVDFVDSPLVDRAKDALAAGAKLEAARKYREALASYAAALDCVADPSLADAARERRRKVVATLDLDAAKELAPLLAKPQAAGLRAFVAKWPAELPSVASARAAAEPLGAEEWAKAEAAKPTAPALRTFIKSWGGYDAARPAIAALDAFAQQAWADFEKLKPGPPRTRALARFPDQWDGTPTGAHARELLGKEVVDEINEIRQLPEDVQITRLQALFAELRGSKLGKDIDARLDELEKAQQAKAKAGR